MMVKAAMTTANATTRIVAKRPVLAISIGCPAGVGPEVSVHGAKETAHEVTPILVGDRAVLEAACLVRRVTHPIEGERSVENERSGEGERSVENERSVEAEPRIKPVFDAASIAALAPGEVGWWAHSTQLATQPSLGTPTPEDGRAQLAWIDEATDLVRAGLADALVTGPVSKAIIAASGAPMSATFRGHTEHLAARLAAPEVIMAFASDEFVTALVTTHLAIADVPAAVTKEAVACAIFHLAELVAALARTSPSNTAVHASPSSAPSSAAPRIAVASLNPHAGEAGLLGREEIDAIAPGIALARKRLADAGVLAEIVGPIGAETAIRLAANGVYAGVVTMYHDQATIPSKLLGFGEAVNITLGLPIVRTSVDHGTAYDVAGTGRADPKGMIEALRMAARLAADSRWSAPPASNNAYQQKMASP